MLCDVCNDPVPAGDGARVNKQTFAKLLDLGFGIHPLNLKTLTDAGMPRDEAMAMLRENFMSLTSDWLLCQSCSVNAKQVLRTAERGEQEHGQGTLERISASARDMAGAIRERDPRLWDVYLQHCDDLWEQHGGRANMNHNPPGSVKEYLLASTFIGASYHILGDKTQRNAMAQGYSINVNDLGYDLDGLMNQHIKCE